ncbi:hypothetical protein V1506DRAFT_554568 [Lipomyces tetrasporus]
MELYQSQEHPELLHTVRRPLSPDTQIKIRTRRSEFEHVLQILEEEGANKARKVAILSAVPSPLHGEMEWGWCLTLSHKGRNGAKSHFDDCRRSWSVTDLYEPESRYSFSVCALRCRVGIAMRSNEEKRIAIQNVEHVLRAQLLANPFGPLKIGEDSWFGKVATVVLETYRLEDETSPPDSLFIPTQSFTIVDEGRFVGGEEATRINFFQQDWFEGSFGSAMVQTAIERFGGKWKVQRV